jgi:pyruvate kinase
MAKTHPFIKPVLIYTRHIATTFIMNDTTSQSTVRKTKIVATIGPACSSPEMLKAMIKAGMNVARLNLSHGSHESHRQQIDILRQAAIELGRNIAIMIDTRGIEIRTGKLEDGPVKLSPDDKFSLHTNDSLGNASGVPITYQKLFEEVRAGIPILIDDGAIELEVENITDRVINCRVIHGGELGDSKSVNLPESQLAMSAVSPENRDDIVKELSFAVENDVDYIAASFIQSADDIYKMREILIEKEVNIPIIAKIENRAGVANMDEIVDAADGIMVARGDLGVELPLADVPSTQKKLIRTTVSGGKPVITATQMLASMERNPKPTRAEASDVANAILDGTSAVMLSGETAVGKYPLEAIEILSTIAKRAEASLSEYGYLQKFKPIPANAVTQAVAQASVNLASNLKASAIISLTETGFTSRLISKYRPECPLLAVTASEIVARKLAMNWGVIAVLYDGEPTDEARINFAIESAQKLSGANSGDLMIITAGHHQQAGGTDLVRVVTL